MTIEVSHVGNLSDETENKDSIATLSAWHGEVNEIVLI